MSIAKISAQLFLLAIACILYYLPRPVFLALARLLACILYFVRFRRNTIVRNMKICFPEHSSGEIDRLMRENYFHLSCTLLEFLQFFFRLPCYLDKHASFRNEHYYLDTVKKHGACFILSAHIGNWETLVNKSAIKLGHPVAIITKRLKPDFLHELAQSTREKLGVTMAFEPKTMRAILAAAKSGGAIGFMMDQYAGAPVGARVPFFNKAVGSHTALAILVEKLHLPVVPAIAHRENNGDHILEFYPPLQTVYATDAPPNVSDVRSWAILQNTRLFVRQTETWIRAYPEQWLWVHRRFKGNIAPLAANSLGELLT